MKLAIALALAVPSLAHAEIACDTHAAMIAFIESYGETVIQSKFAYSQEEEFLGWLEWTANEKTTSWTLLLTSHGKTCMLASGKNAGLHT